jgi:hypothetical protein
MLAEEAPQLTLADTEAIGEDFDTGVVAIECAVGDEGKSAGDGVGCATPGGEVRSGFRPTTKAGTEAGYLSGGGGAEEAAVLETWRAGWADRPAVNASGCDTYEEKAVEARVTALQCSIADFAVWQFHRGILSLDLMMDSRFSDVNGEAGFRDQGLGTGDQERELFQGSEIR